MSVFRALVDETAPGAGTATVDALRDRIAALLELTKPRITALVVVTALVGFALGARDGIDWVRLLHTLVGTALVAGGASALNQIVERDADARMRRTRGRPLPSARLDSQAALVFAVDTAALGLVWLALGASRGASYVAALTLAAYVFAYTPLKTRTAWCTVVGAIPGALPPVIGWVAARGELGLGALALFALLFTWQLPHFYAIAWLYRDEYARAGFRMLSAGDASGRRTALAMAGTSLLLLAASLITPAAGRSGPLYLTAALVLGLTFVALALGFVRRRDPGQARRVFLYSVLYLPLVLLCLVFDFYRSGRF
jgi:protoheme IX farnesyltransferase